MQLKRLIGAGAGVIFKGSGFYETDYRSDNYKQGQKNAKPAAKKETKKKEEKPKAKTESKKKTKKDKS